MRGTVRASCQERRSIAASFGVRVGTVRPMPLLFARARCCLPLLALRARAGMRGRESCACVMGAEVVVAAVS